MRWRSFLLLPLTLVVAVAAIRLLPEEPGSAPPASIPASGSAAVLPEEQSSGALLWARPRDASPGGSERSLWLAPGGQLLRGEPGLFFLRGEAPARLTAETRTTPLPPCPRGHTPFPARTTQRTLLRSDASSEVELIPFTERTALLVEELHHPLAALGDTLFFRVDRVEDPCEEQPRYGASFLVLRVGPSGVERIHTDPILASGLARSQAAARLGARLGPSVRVAAAELRPTMVLPFFTGEGAGWSVQLTARVPWELSFGGWGSETASELIPGSEAPPWSTSQTVPATALRHAREHPEETVIGVQRLP